MTPTDDDRRRRNSPLPTDRKTLRYRGATITLDAEGSGPSPASEKTLRYRGATTALPSAPDTELTELRATLAQAEEQSKPMMSPTGDLRDVSHRIGLILVAKQLTAVAERLKKDTEILEEMQTALYEATPADSRPLESAARSGSAQELEAVIAEQERKTVAALLSSVCDQADVLVGLADRLPFFSKAQDDTDALVNINACIDEIVESSQAETKSLVVKELTPIPDVFAAKEEICLILTNVIENSLRAVEERRQGRGIIRIETRHQDEAVLVSIIDNGVGIEPENRNKVFSPFYTSRAEALGMGLATAQYLVKKYRGAIIMHSLPDQGTMVRISLPIGVCSETD